MKRVVVLLCSSWAGLHCLFVLAYENLALNKSAWLSSTWGSRGADRAVDGQTSDIPVYGSQCATSRTGKETEWRVDLDGVFSIHHIIVQYVSENDLWDENYYWIPFILGFSVYVSNTTDKENGVLCFRDNTYTKSTIPNTVNITCPYFGRYVIYHNNRTDPPYPRGYSSDALVALCEVEVFGCSLSGYYGENCSKLCPENCQEGHCDIVEGTCLGCRPGYKGPKCNEECDEHTYGLECTDKCGNCSGGIQCNHVTGFCANGCDAGVHGDRCDIECPGGYYGDNCERSCSRACGVPGLCDKITGSCYGSCQTGWEGELCEDECGNNTYGLMCKESCGNCSNSEQCHHVDGSCQFGCDAGTYGVKCDMVCLSGRYGLNCAKSCGQNCQGCNRFDGVCEFGCLKGWEGKFCEIIKCEFGTFGENCTGVCGKCVDDEPCHHRNGSCLNGCGRGFHGQHCNEKCSEGFYGDNCEQNCSMTCEDPGGCDRITGYCNGSCQAGWTGDLCESECPDGRYGYNCRNNCRVTCGNTSHCDRITGHCIGGCQAGWKGDLCEKGQNKSSASSILMILPSAFTMSNDCL